MAQPKAFYSYMENEDKLNMLSDEQAGRLYKSLYAYSRTGEKPDLSDDPLLAYAFADFKIDIDRDRDKYDRTCERRAEAGRKGGEAKAANAKNDVANLANANFAKNDVANPSKSSETEAETEVTKVTKEKDIEKERFGEFQNVLLSADEVHKLSTAFPKDWRDRVERLSQYLAQTGKRYRSHYATILAWARKDKPPDNKRGSVFSAESASFDLNKYARRDIFDG